jgi:FdhE protein
MSAPGAQTATSPFAAHRKRADVLRDRHPYAAEMLTLYLALLHSWEEAWRAARAEQPDARELAGWAAKRVLPRVVQATVEFGPRPLATAVGEIGANGSAEPLLTGWLAGDELGPVERYLARAVLRGPLEVVDAATACAADPAPRGGRNCEHCGGLPQLSFRSSADDALVSGRRYLACTRCGGTWNFSSSTCASCGETTGARRTVFAEHRDGAVVGRRNGHTADDGPTGDPPLFPHLRIESCDSCQRYLIDVDMGQDARAVPEVDELTAVPLDLYASERGLSKIAPNLMGF